MPGFVEVAESGEGRYAQVVRAGHHELRADEPPGTGDDTGPTPYEFLLAALGACTSMTLRMYAERKGWALTHVAVRLRHDRVHATDCAENGRCERIECELEIQGDLSDEQRARLLEIAERCPVHRTLTGDLSIATELA